ncbi:MAG: helix-turn-helix transcriptional regulator [Vallitaleaceae bacterium]|nr:helix-turn-helix transcriptional regulator [Vallitaleaceae bacterium]
MSSNINLTYLKLKIIIAELNHCAPSWNWNSDINQWKGYHLWYVAKGGSTIEVAGEKYHLVPRDCFIFNLSENHLCTHYSQNPLSVYTVYFQVYDHDEFISFSPDNFPRYKHIVESELFEGLIKRCINAHQNGMDEKAVIWLYSILQEFFDLHNVVNIEVPEEKINELCLVVSQVPERNYSLKMLSDISGYSENHLIKLFLQYKRVTPHRFCMNEKIYRAKTLLLYSSNKICEISEFLQFTDVSHFARQFKKHTGLSPYKFRSSAK